MGSSLVVVRSCRYGRDLAGYVKLGLSDKFDPRGVLLLAKRVEQALDAGRATIMFVGLDAEGHDAYVVSTL